MAEVKRDQPGNKLLQECRIPKLAGGVTDGLIGIQYNLIHPEAVHTLDSGLSIFRSKLVGHKTGFNAMIGGPHSSFDCLCEQAGGVVNMVANFIQGLEKYRAGDWRPPRLPYAPMTMEEKKFATEMNACMGDLEVLNDYKHLEETEDNLAESFNQLIDQLEESPVSDTVGEREEAVCCVDCGEHFDSKDWVGDCFVLSGVENDEVDEKVRELKKKFSLLESGLEIDYRCVKCRECSQCKNADLAEKVSLRQEQEMQLVKESVFLDWEKKKIVCTLPVRGEEYNFLTTNRDRAVKVLDQQCKKWFQDPVNKEAVLAAFEKLF